MRGQTSIEFIILLSAVAAFAVSVLGIYLHMSHTQTDEYLALLNSTSNVVRNQSDYASVASTNRTLEYIYAPSVAYVNQSNIVQVVVYSENATIKKLLISAQGVESEPNSYSNKTINQVQVFDFSIIPETVGEINLTVAAEIQTQSQIMYQNRSVSLYATLQSENAITYTTTSLPVFIPSLSETSGSVMSSILPEGNLSYISETSHCGYMGFWGYKDNMDVQCGSSASWYYYSISDPCYYDYGVLYATTCIYKNSINSTLYSIGTPEKYLYNDSLRLSNASAGTTLYSYIDSSTNTSALVSSLGSPAGNVLVSGAITAYIPTQDDSYYVIGRSGNHIIINSSDGNQYLQLYSTLNDVMGYYNGTDVGDSEIATIQQTIGSYNKGVAEAYNSTNAKSPCSIYEYQGNTFYSCSPFGEIDFSNITVEIDSSIPHANGSFSLAGSYIYVR